MPSIPTKHKLIFFKDGKPDIICFSEVFPLLPSDIEDRMKRVSDSVIMLMTLHCLPFNDRSCCLAKIIRNIDMLSLQISHKQLLAYH